ncbi:MAG: TPR repeat protein [Motiliproteus sp.]|jgi:TPR repeat protein
MLTSLAGLLLPESLWRQAFRGRAQRSARGRALGVMLLLSLSAQADAGMDELVSELQQGQVEDAALQLQGMQGEQRADGLFLLGWLYRQGSYGVGRDPQRGQAWIQQAAELGQFDAMHYCWRRCLTLTPGVQEQLRLGVERNQPQALYLLSLYPQELLLQSGSGEETADRLTPDQLLLEAARRGHPDAIGRLYSDYFVSWAAQPRTLDAAVSKLQRCVLGVCHLLLGTLYERHNDHQQALFNYQLLALVDPPLYRQYLDAGHLQQLLAALPPSALALVQSRAASYLAQRDTNADQQFDRFKHCGADYPCIRQLSLTDPFCMLSYFEASHLPGLRDSEGYRACQAEFASL